MKSFFRSMELHPDVADKLSKRLLKDTFHPGYSSFFSPFTGIHLLILPVKRGFFFLQLSVVFSHFKKNTFSSFSRQYRKNNCGQFFSLPFEFLAFRIWQWNLGIPLPFLGRVPSLALFLKFDSGGPLFILSQGKYQEHPCLPEFHLLF